MGEPLNIKAIPTMFGEIKERNVCFLIDTSGSMYTSIEVVKEHLVEALLKHAYTHRDAMFNIVEFNSEVSQWADKMVQCTPDTVKIAGDWIKKLHAKTGTNTQDALLTAFCDPGCEAVYLVTDGLPDQNPEDILDHVAYASQNRPVHCIYLTGETSEGQATEFLQDLAHETYGSFHVVTITNHGCVDRVTPVYRADHTAKRLLRTTQGAIVPNDKNCSITTTLAADPFDTVEIAAEVIAPRVYLKDGIPVCHPYAGYPYAGYPYAGYPYAYPYGGLLPHHPYHWNQYLRSAPQYGWSRYRPAKSWLQEDKKVIDTANNIAFSPAAGALLIGKEVLARRAADGFYYAGKVKSQLSSDKFLVELGPTKHGKYTDTAYQETFLHDIISKHDAMRHSIVPGDKVLAPWEPEGERFCPGVVLEGSEKRAADGGGSDSELSVSFVIGRSATVPVKTAVWLPLALHERLSLELQMPKDARKTLETLESYPERSLPGYPATATKRSPDEYEGPQPVTIGPANLVYDHGQYYHPDYVPITPVMFKHQEKKSAVTAADLDKIVPGTHMTEAELNEKVMSQLMEHKMKLEDKRGRLEKDIRMLRRQKMKKENSLKKSVEFDLYQDDLENDLDYYDLENQDSGCGLSLADTDDVGTQTMSMRSTSSDPLYPRRRRREEKQPWKYWNSDPSPSMMDGPTHEPYSETAVQAPLENRPVSVGPYGVQWSDSAFGHVDHNARSTYDRQILEKMLHEPRPPTAEKESKYQSNGKMTWEDKEEARRNFRRKRVMARQQEHHEKLDRQDHMKLLMSDQHRETVKKRIDYENGRRQKEFDQIEQSRQARRQLHNEITGKIGSKSMSDSDREARRIEALRIQQVRREEARAAQVQRTEAQAQSRQEAKIRRAQGRWDETHNRLVTEEAQNTVRDQQVRNAKINRREHFRQLEEEGQKRRELRISNTEQSQALYRSTVLA